MSWIFKNVIPNIGTITEGPCWNGKELLFSNIAQNRVLSYNPNNNKVYEFTSDTGGANGLNYNKKQELFACEGTRRNTVSNTHLTLPTNREV